MTVPCARCMGQTVCTLLPPQPRRKINARWIEHKPLQQQQGALPAAMTTSGAPAEVVEALLQQLFADLGDPQDAEVCQYLAAGLLQDEDADADELR